jgi:hypothetical protein
MASFDHMAEPTGLQKLDPMTRCFTPVGWFPHAWALMENSLHAAIGEALVIEPRKLQILCANMGFRDSSMCLTRVSFGSDRSDFTVPER